MKKFPHINQFHDIIKRVNYYCDKYGKVLPTLTFIGRVKLHGTNVSIRRHNSNFYIQGRNRVITTEYDQYDFAKRIGEIPLNELDKLFDGIGNQTDDITIFGEYIGTKIQNKVAVSMLDRQWVIFSALVNEKFIVDVNQCELPNYNIYNINQIPSYSIDIDFNNLDDAVVNLQRVTEEVEQQCPWANKFNIQGIGEGLVWYWKNAPEDPTMWFKTKGEKHSKSKKPRKSIKISPEKITSIEEFVNLTVNLDRLSQGYEYVINNVNKSPSIKELGSFLKWISQDILREDVDLLKLNNLEWNDVTKEVTLKAKQWFLTNLYKGI